MALFVAYAVARFAARAALAFTKFESSAAFLAGDILFFAGAVFVAAFSALWTASQRFLVAATIAALPAALSLRFVFGAGAVTAAGASDSPRTFAHLRCCASRILRNASGENFLRLRVGASVVAAVSTGAPESTARSSAI